MINFSKFFQPPPRSSFTPTMALLPVILIVNLTTKSNHKPNDSNFIAVNSNYQKCKTAWNSS